MRGANGSRAANLAGSARRGPVDSTCAPTLAELIRSSVWLGLVGFGGGISVLGAIEHLAVRRRGWLTPREYAGVATVAQMLPGGAAAHALAHLGFSFRGLPGAIAAYTGFIAPGAVLTVAAAWTYVRFGVPPAPRSSSPASMPR